MSGSGPSSQLDAKSSSKLLAHALLLDLEVSHQGKILKVGAVLGDETFARSGRFALREVWSELSRFARRASLLFGHNLLRHDLPVLRQSQPDHPLLRLPVIDTLALSPLAFPENPYHRLVKDYKLVRESLNDPVADARQSAVLFRDEFHTLQALRRTEPGLFELLHYTLATRESSEDTGAQGMALMFEAMDAAPPSTEVALEHARELFARWGCRAVPVDASLLATGTRRLALAYAASWLRVAGSNSVLPTWVRHQFPETRQLLQRLREQPCSREDCVYCRRTHDARHQLRTFFGFDDFRPQPVNANGGSLQRDIVEAGLRNESMLAILPTGGGKSLCFQLPALVRNYRRGVLTVVISPLQALMKDQVDGLMRRTGTPFAAALYGLLTPPERGDVLRRVRLGDVAILYVSPEQLRNVSLRKAIAQREIGCWVFDEAHCLSKWGHDFRPDYLYAGRFIREFSDEQQTDIPAIACFTATAKRDVKEEIIAYFKNETGRDLGLFEGGVERDNLRFEVESIPDRAKFERMHELLAERLPDGRGGSAIVFRATRESTEVSAQFLQSKGWRAAHFHAGVAAPEKKRIQDEFLAGDIQVICATNAFGMGIDKEDVRLVIHGDTPGSLENYLQEAGRAGRDGLLAECVLLFAEADCEQQFKMGALSELSRRDIVQILRSLRKAARGGEEIVITAGEILRDEEMETDMELHDRQADTKVRTAVSWLERAGLLQRNENATNVFQARLLVQDLQGAATRMAPLNLSQNEQALWLALLRELMNAGSTESLTVDQLALLPEFVHFARAKPGKPANPEYVSAKILKTLGSMAKVGLLKRDMLLNAFVRHKVADPSRKRFNDIVHLDRKLIDLLSETEPDPVGWMPLSLRRVNQLLIDDGCDSSTETVRSLLRSLSEDGRGFAGAHGSIDLRFASRDTYRVRVRRSWQAITELAQRRRAVAELALDVILAKIPRNTPPQSDLLVEFSFAELREAVERDMLLRNEVKDLDAALERALMYLHEQRVIILQQGLAVFRSAMTIRLKPESRAVKYTADDYRPLQHHYRERVLQVHVMGEYARRGLRQMREALRLVLEYFTMEKETFIRRFLGDHPELLKHATTAQSYQRIVTDLDHPAQIRIVTAPVSANMLVLAGPGSGKTRTIVHRCAYLLRVRRVRPQSILVCCFNRRAAIELRRRLTDLVGGDARGVTVLTYHGLALRLLGRSLADREDAAGSEPDFDAMITDAVRLLRGERLPVGLEPDETRDRLLGGFQFILVDEYQDIDEAQYELISAMAGRTLDDPELKLSIMAVGDDDQNIYTFRGANVEFIRRFQQDYQAKIHYLVENYRATRHLIDAANRLIRINTDRMKTGHPIRIDRHRETDPPGGEFEARDDLTKGKAQIIQVADEAAQGPAVVAELKRLQSLGVTDWGAVAVLSSTHQDLALVRAWAERETIPVRWSEGLAVLPPLPQIREIRRFLHHLDESRRSLARAGDMVKMVEKLFADTPPNEWIEWLRRMIEAWRAETSDAELPIQEALEFFYEHCAESRRDLTQGTGVYLSTVHAAKGMEFDHVLLMGPWVVTADSARCEETLRVVYVGITRARKTLALFERADVPKSLVRDLDGSAVCRHAFTPTAAPCAIDAMQYEVLGLEDIHLGFPGRHAAKHALHTHLARLQPGDKLQMRRDVPSGVVLCLANGVPVARLSRQAAAKWWDRIESVRETRVLAMAHRRADQDDDPERSQRYRVREWEFPIVEVVCRTRGDNTDNRSTHHWIP